MWKCAMLEKKYDWQSETKVAKPETRLSKVLPLHEAVHLGAQPGIDSWHLLLRQTNSQPLPLPEPGLPRPATLHC